MKIKREIYYVKMRKWEFNLSPTGFININNVYDCLQCGHNNKFEDSV